MKLSTYLVLAGDFLSKYNPIDAIKIGLFIWFICYLMWTVKRSRLILELKKSLVHCSKMSDKWTFTKWFKKLVFIKKVLFLEFVALCVLFVLLKLDIAIVFIVLRGKVIIFRRWGLKMTNK